MPSLKFQVNRIERKAYARTEPAIKAVVTFDMGEIFVIAEAATHVETEPAVHLHAVDTVEQVLRFLNSRRRIFGTGKCHVVIGVHFLVALAEPCERKRE